MAIETVVEEVASNLEEVAEVTRQVNTMAVRYFGGGVLVGFGLGFYFGYKFNKEKIRAEAFRESEEEVDRIRKEYQQRVVAAQPKRDPEDIVEEKGYDVPQLRKVDRLKPPVPGVVEPSPLVEPPTERYPGWSYPEEIQNRPTDGSPYVIHQDEFSEGVPGYSSVTYTYYAGDDVIVDEENEQPVPHADIVVGRKNLKFGHGTDDENVVFVRNDRLELQMEICRTTDSYAEVVLGIENNETDTD